MGFTAGSREVPGRKGLLQETSITYYNNNNNNSNNNNNNNNNNFKLYWNRSILTDKTTPFNRPYITFMNKITKNTFLIDIAVPNTHNLTKTIADKQNKYQELANEICAMWK
jgi:hypothetical protein